MNHVLFLSCNCLVIVQWAREKRCDSQGTRSLSLLTCIWPHNFIGVGRQGVLSVSESTPGHLIHSLPMNLSSFLTNESIYILDQQIYLHSWPIHLTTLLTDNRSLGVPVSWCSKMLQSYNNCEVCQCGPWCMHAGLTLPRISYWCHIYYA